MYELIETRTLRNGYKIEIARAKCVDNPRNWKANLGHMYTWSLNLASPDENPYDDAVDFVRGMISRYFTLDEMIDAIKEGAFANLRYQGQLEADCQRGVAAAEDVAHAISLCQESPRFLARKCAISTIYCHPGEYATLSSRPAAGMAPAGAVGFIWAGMDEVREALQAIEGLFPSAESPEEGLRRRAQMAFDCELEAYSSYLSSDIYNLRLMRGDDVIDAVKNVYGFDLDDIIEELGKKAELRERQ